MAGRYKLTNPLEISRPTGKKKGQTEPTQDAVEETVPSDIPIGTDFIQERPVFVPVKDKEVMQSIGLLRQYLRDTGLSLNMNKITTAILQGTKLPYNPYPEYVQRFSIISERFHTKRETLQQIQRRMSHCTTYTTGTGVLSGVKMQDMKLWGLQHLLMNTNPKVLSFYRNMVKSVTITSEKLNVKLGDAISLITTIKGPCIFAGSVYDNCFKMNIGVSVLAKASNLQDAATNFGRAVLYDITHISKDSNSFVMSLQVTVAEGDALRRKVLSSDELERLLLAEESQEKDDLIQSIGFAALKKHDCIVNLLLDCGEDRDILKMKYIRAVKSYNLMTLMVEGLQQNSSLYISTAPYQALHEGLFIEQSEAELYLSTFKKYSKSKSPLSQPVCTGVQKIWQEKLAGRQLASDLLIIVHYQWLIERVQNQTKPATSRKEDSLSVELCRVSQCLGFKLENMITLITLMYDIITHKLGMSKPDLLGDIMSLLRTHLLEYFNEDSHELSTSYAKSVVSEFFTEMEKLIEEKKFDKLQERLNFLKGYLKFLSIRSMEDAVDGFLAIRNTQSQIDNILQVSFGNDLNIDLRSDAYRHRFENSGFVDIEKKQIDISLSAATVAAPPQVAQQAARMRYCMDVKIDEVWKEFMQNIFIVRQNLPPNPYPCLIDHLRQASLKVQLYREDDSAILRKFLSSKPRVYDSNLGIYSTPGISAYGLLSTVVALNSVGFKQVNAMATTVAISTPPSSGSGSPAIAAGAFEIKCLMAICNECLFYGSVSPYLTHIDSVEYCFIKGPKTQEHDGAVALGKILLIYLGNLQTQGILTIRATFGDIEIELEDLNSASAEFQSQMSSMITSKKPAVLHLLIPLDWRYVYIKKNIHIYYINEMNNEGRFVTEQDPIASYQQVFSNGHDAVEYMRKVRSFQNKKSGFLEEKIAEVAKQHNWPSVAQLALSMALKNGSVESMDKDMIELALFCWRLFHSPYGFLHYSVAINAALNEAFKYGSDTNNKTLQDKLKTMVFGYRNCLNSVLSSKNSMTGTAVNLYCQTLLQNFAPCNAVTGTANLTNRTGIMATLTHINSVTHSAADSIAVDLINCMHRIKELVKSTNN